MPVLRRLNLETITTADGRERIARQQSGFQGGRRAVHHKCLALAFIEAKFPKLVGVECALIREVVNRKERARSRVIRIMMAARTKLCGGKTAGPVVEMNDVRRRAQTLEERERRATEKGET